MAVQDPFEVISSEDLLARITEVNEKIENMRNEKENENESYDWREDYLLIGTEL